MKKVLLAMGLCVVWTGAAHAEGGSLMDAPDAIWESMQESGLTGIGNEDGLVDTRSTLSDGLRNKAMANDILDALLSDPLYSGDCCNITVKVGNSVVNYVAGLRRDTMGQKEILKPSQWAVDVSAIAKGAGGGISGNASAKIEVQHKDDKAGTTTTVKIEITITKK